MEISANLIRGHIDTMILKTLLEGKRYGYEILKLLSGNGVGYEMKEPTLYSALRRLEVEGLVSSEWGDGDDYRRKFYFLTPMGQYRYSESIKEWEYSKQIIDGLIK